jgi:4-hydroxyphenylacetate 3-monooxygenase
MSRTGEEYLESLRDGRRVYVNGERVEDVTEHPAFAESARSIAHLYDIAASPQHRDVMTYPSPKTGKRVNKAFLMPRTREDLAARREAMTLWAEATYGIMGRSPDHLASLLTGLALRPDIFDRGGPEFAARIIRYYERVREHDLYVSTVMHPPQIDRSTPGHQHEDPTLHAGVVEAGPEGIFVSGAQILGTGSILSNEVMLSNVGPLHPGDDRHAISVALPIATRGLRIIARRPYADRAPSVYDYPLTTRFDETDALLVFDHVFVPWARVFVYRNRAVTAAQFVESPALVLAHQQGHARFAVKARFLAGIAHRLAEACGVEKQATTQAKLGELASYAAMAHGIQLGAEANHVTDPRGFVYPDPTQTFANTWMQASYYGTMLDTLREIGGASLLQVASSHRDYHNPEIAPDLHRYLASKHLDSVARTKLFNLAWDLVGSEFAGRHELYERFHAGSRSGTCAMRTYRTFDFAGARALVDHCLAGYRLPSADVETLLLAG